MMNRLDCITILRAVAILMVLLVHVGMYSDGMQHIHPYILSVFDNGARGVQLFYILSAFTLFLSFSNRKGEKTPIKNYFIRRFFRIVPLFFVAVGYYLWLYGTGPRYFLGNASGITVGNVLSTLTFTNSFNPYWINSIFPGQWSVAIETVFYLFMPFLFNKIRHLEHAFIFVVFTICLRFALHITLQRHPLISDTRLWNDYLFLYLPSQLPCFSLGILLYFVIYKTDDRISPKVLFIGTCIVTCGLAIDFSNFMPDYLLIAAVFSMIIFSLHRYHNGLLFNSFFKLTGELSYTIFVTHWAVLYLLQKSAAWNTIGATNEPTAILNFIVNYLLTFSLSLIISIPLYHLIEIPMQKVGKKLISD
ncbi:acyltransferase family protein [Mucilaginibacter sp. HD30]